MMFVSVNEAAVHRSDKEQNRRRMALYGLNLVLEDQVLRTLRLLAGCQAAPRLGRCWLPWLVGHAGCLLSDGDGLRQGLDWKGSSVVSKRSRFLAWARARDRTICNEVQRFAYIQT